MPHWKSLHIERFRRLENLRLDELGSVNLLVGKNNSGKTSVLEALAIASHPFSPLNWINTAWEREVKSARTPVLEVLSWMFPRQAPRQNGFEGLVNLAGCLDERHGNDLGLVPARDIRIEAGYREFREVDLRSTDLACDSTEVDGPSEYAAEMTVRLRRREVGTQTWEDERHSHQFRGDKPFAEEDWPALVPHQLVSPVSHRTNAQLLAAVDQVLGDRRKNQLVDLMAKFASDLDDIEIRSPQGRRAVIYLHHRNLGHVPLSMEGDGMRRALTFASAASLAKGGILLLDEVETALHPEALAGMFRFLVGVCRETQVQLFVTTHSLEAVDAMLGSLGTQPDGLVAYHLPPRGTSLSAYRLGGESIRSMRKESGLDLR